MFYLVTSIDASFTAKIYQDKYDSYLLQINNLINEGTLKLNQLHDKITSEITVSRTKHNKTAEIQSLPQFLETEYF